MRGEVVKLHGAARIERPPERPEYLEPDLAATIAWSHSYQIVASRLPPQEDRCYIGKSRFSGQNRHPKSSDRQIFFLRHRDCISSRHILRTLVLSVLSIAFLCAQQDLNLQPLAPEANAL